MSYFASTPDIDSALQLLRKWFPLPEASPVFDKQAAQVILEQTASRLQENFPYHHPFYLGQMLKPPHPIAREAYHLAMYLNPNNHALDGGRASSVMEKEAVAELARMFGWSTHLGHLTSGGTFANLEALWICRELAPGKVVLASKQAHYTHARISAVLGIPFRSVACDTFGCMDLQSLEKELQRGDVGAVVATLGTTAAGSIDPLPAILKLREKYGFRLHVDAAYGGYFTLASKLQPSVRAAYDALSQVDSIVIDPHKHGLQPYGCGCILFRDPSVGRFYQHDSPYTYFSSNELHLGEISLECSRPGASAVALWATMQLLPAVKAGRFAESLDTCLEAARSLVDYLQNTGRFVPIFQPALDIVVWTIKSPSASAASSWARQFFDTAARHDIHLALASFPRQMVEPCQAIETWDAEQVTCLRSCLMKPEHLTWMPEITKRLDAAVAEMAVMGT